MKLTRDDCLLKFSEEDRIVAVLTVIGVISRDFAIEIVMTLCRIFEIKANELFESGGDQPKPQSQVETAETAPAEEKAPVPAHLKETALYPPASETDDGEQGSPVAGPLTPSPVVEIEAEPATDESALRHVMAEPVLEEDLVGKADLSAPPPNVKGDGLDNDGGQDLGQMDLGELRAVADKPTNDDEPDNDGKGEKVDEPAADEDEDVPDSDTDDEPSDDKGVDSKKPSTGEVDPVAGDEPPDGKKPTGETPTA